LCLWVPVLALSMVLVCWCAGVGVGVEPVGCQGLSSERAVGSHGVVCLSV
jgi:hypothetical protein